MFNIGGLLLLLRQKRNSYCMDKNIRNDSNKIIFYYINYDTLIVIFFKSFMNASNELHKLRKHIIANTNTSLCHMV